MKTSEPSARSPLPQLLPQEHGGYAQLAFPLLTALVIGRPGLGSIFLALACLAAFLAHEPLLVALGRRGGRKQKLLGRPAWLAFALASTAAVGFGAAGAWLSREFIWALAVPAAFALALAPMIVLGRERTTPGELLAAWTLAAFGFPVALAAQVSLRDALVCLAVWDGAYLIATLAVRSTLAVAKGKPSAPLARGAGASAAALAAAGIALALAHEAPWAAVIAFSPLAALAVAIAFRPPDTRHLRAVGWGLVAASSATFLLLVGGLR